MENYGFSAQARGQANRIARESRDAKDAEIESLRQQLTECQLKYDQALNMICNFEDMVSEYKQQLEATKLEAERYRWVIENCIRVVTISADNLPANNQAIDAAIGKEPTC